MKKLYRSRQDSKLFGLCGGLAELIHVDSTLLRVVLIVTAFFSGGTIIPLYFIACLVIPKEPPFDPYYDPAYGYSNRRSDYANNPYSSSYGATGPTASSYGAARPEQPRYDDRRYRPNPNNDPFQPLSGTGYTAPPQPRSQSSSYTSQSSQRDHLDEMMREVEKKALMKEVEQLRAKLAQYEKKNENE